MGSGFRMTGVAANDNAPHEAGRLHFYISTIPDPRLRGDDGPTWIPAQLRK